MEHVPTSSAPGISSGEPTPGGEDRFQTLANLSPIGIFEADATGCCTFMNRVWEVICQQPVDKALGFGWLDVVHPDDRRELARPPLPNDPTQAPVEQQFRIVRPSGEVRSLRIRLGSVRSSAGAHIGWSGTFEDITDALRSADALRIATRQQEAVSALGLLALGGASRRTLLEEVRRRTTDALGALRVEVTQRSADDYPGVIAACIDDPRHELRTVIAYARDDTRFVERDVHFLQSIANILSTFLQHERLDARARRRERWLRAYFERSPDVVLRLDAEARILDANPAAERVLCAPTGALRNQSSQRLGFSDVAMSAWRIAIRQVFTSQSDQTLDLELETAHGPRRYATRLTAVADDEGHVEFVGAILRDATDHALVQQELKQLQRQLFERDERLQSLVGELMGERVVLRDRARAWGLAALTPRERTILRLLANGRTNREIALELGLSAGTVKNRIGLLLPKLGAADRTQAVAIAFRLGLVDGPADRIDVASPETRPLPYFNLGEFE